MNSVTVGGPGLVAVGRDGTIGDFDAAVWTSVDGVTWSRVPHDETVFGGTGIQTMESVTAGGPGLVAVGTDGSAYDEEGYLLEYGDAAVWTSSDGVTWSRVPHDDAIFGGKPVTRMGVVTVGGPGLVAVGAEGWHEGGPGGNGAIWTSVDGITWTRVPHDEATFGGAGLSGLAAWGSGLIAVGGHHRGAAVWIFNEGIS